MITNVDELRSYLGGLFKKRSISPEAVEVFLDDAVFLDGSLKSFRGDFLKETLTVSDFEEFLSQIGAKVTLGDDEARPMRENYKWSNMNTTCIWHVAFYC